MVGSVTELVCILELVSLNALRSQDFYENLIHMNTMRGQDLLSTPPSSGVPVWRGGIAVVCDV